VPRITNSKVTKTKENHLQTSTHKNSCDVRDGGGSRVTLLEVCDP